MFFGTLANAVTLTGNRFIMIIDEWDAPIRESIGHPAVQKEYLEFLRSLFKNSGTTDKIFAAAYMTGILPIKKDGSQSAISDFKEFSMINPWRFSKYVGFTETEVKLLCEEHHSDFVRMKQWYDGYTLGKETSIYNPNSVMEALRYDNFRSYWTETSTAKSLMAYISLDFDGLSKTFVELLGGIDVAVDTNGFANDLVTFRNRDDVLTLLIHLGYLSYQEETGKAHIPNEEIRLEFAKAIRGIKRDETIRRMVALTKQDIIVKSEGWNMIYTTDQVMDPSEFPFDIFEGSGEPGDAPQDALRLHNHSCLEINYVVRDGGSYFIGDQEYCTPEISVSSTTRSTIWP